MVPVPCRRHVSEGVPPSSGGPHFPSLRSLRCNLRKPTYGSNFFFNHYAAPRSDVGHAGCSQRSPVASPVLSSGDLQSVLKGQLILAPLTRACHPPFRRLCSFFGCEVTMSEMAYARKLVKGDKKERARLRMFPGERAFGVQIATNAIDEGVKAACIAHEAGASFVDLNCGCPIYEATRRGLGAALLRRPAKLARLVEGLTSGSPIPVTVKIRTGESSKKLCAETLVPMLHAAGAAAVTVHGRTMEQRYKRPADWLLIDQLARAGTGPVIGNGDVLTHYEAAEHASGSVHALMAGRGALIKPWLFWEWRQGRELGPGARDRVAILRRFVAYMKEYFHDDALGRQRAFYFLPWHFQFFHRYRPLPESVFGRQSQAAPLMNTRWETHVHQLGEELESLAPLERLLRCPSEDAHLAIADALWDAVSDQDACDRLTRLAISSLLDWEEGSMFNGDSLGKG